VEFIHFVERLYDSTMKTPHGHFEESEAPPNSTDRGSPRPVERVRSTKTAEHSCTSW
jgi:hypothetical protein